MAFGLALGWHEEGVNENDILGSFASDYVYIRSQSSIDILMPRVCSDELKKNFEAFHTNLLLESQICTYSWMTFFHSWLIQHENRISQSV